MNEKGDGYRMSDQDLVEQVVSSISNTLLSGHALTFYVSNLPSLRSLVLVMR
jgi:hypothetical protein